MRSVVQDVVCTVRTTQSSRLRQAGRSAGFDPEGVLLRSPDAEGACRAPEPHYITFRRRRWAPTSSRQKTDIFATVSSSAVTSARPAIASALSSASNRLRGQSGGHAVHSLDADGLVVLLGGRRSVRIGSPGSVIEAIAARRYRRRSRDLSRSSFSAL